ncbi:YodC family protein [Trinickia acidisoli]|uniref:YodC family protein n=1 Tax=Trinickia acidisoli TaxID=2767482 RepID=UPI001A8EF3CD|nr:YodC family protein [Trinickia acidisoli]
MSTATRDLVEQFCVGDVVTLKAGGSRMTVTALCGDTVLCQWFDEHGELRQEMFAREALGREPRSISPGLAHVRRYAGYAAAVAGSVAASVPFTQGVLKPIA